MENFRTHEVDMIIIARILVFLIVTFSVQISGAEEISDWEIYPHMFSIIDALELGDYVYAVTPNGMFRYDFEKKEYEVFYKNHGLDVSNIIAIAASSEKIFLGTRYDGLFRFDPENTILEPILFPEYVDSKDKFRSIAINDIFVESDSILYISHSKGIDRLNLNTEELHTYTKLSTAINEDIPVKQVKIFLGRIWACTAEGLAWADVDDPNLEFAENWDSYSFGSAVNCVLYYQDENDESNRGIYIGTDGAGIYSFDLETEKGILTSVQKTIIYSMDNFLNTCYIGSNRGLYRKVGNSWFLIDMELKPLTVIATGKQEQMWIGTESDGLKCYVRQGYRSILEINGPKSTTLRQISINGSDAVWSATSYREEPGYLQKYQDGRWVCFQEDDGLPSKWITAVHVDSRGMVWGGTFNNGVFVLDDNGTEDKKDDEVFHVDHDRQILISVDDNPNGYVVCTDISEDRHGNIWLAGWFRGAYVLEGTLPAASHRYHNFSFDYTGTTHVVRRIHAEDDGWVWMGTWDTGLIALNVGADPYETSDDTPYFIKQSDGLNSMRIEAIHTDHDGYVWVGSDGGLNRVQIHPGGELEVEDKNQLLGETAVEVMCIEVDKYNNKWIGTSMGLVRINSKNEFVHLYTNENSGILYTSSIFSLEYDNERDILVLGTDAGLCSFNVRGTGGGKEGDIVSVYPNPFELWGTNKRAVFTNLKPLKPLRIYTFTGDLVIELSADVGEENDSASAVWDGSNFKGSLVGSGVYFYTCTDKNGRSVRGKMVVVRR